MPLVLVGVEVDELVIVRRLSQYAVFHGGGGLFMLVLVDLCLVHIEVVDFGRGRGSLAAHRGVLRVNLPVVLDGGLDGRAREVDFAQ